MFGKLVQQGFAMALLAGFSAANLGVETLTPESDMQSLNTTYDYLVLSFFS